MRSDIFSWQQLYQLTVKCKTHKPDFASNFACEIARHVAVESTPFGLFPKHASAITYASTIGNAIFKKTAIFLSRFVPVVAPVFASVFAPHMSNWSSHCMVVALMCEQSRDCRRVTRRVPNSARVRVFRF